MLKKPTKVQKVAHDYNQCIKYIEEKYGFETRNYAGRTYEKGSEGYNAPYQDFWHFMFDNYDINNDSYVMVFEEILDDNEYSPIEQWQYEIMFILLHEFSETHEGSTERFIEFWVSW